jgi:RHS repeat-associated protein
LNRQITDTNSLGKTRTYGYDAVGSLISSIDRNGRKRTYTYDALNRQTAENWLDSSNAVSRTFGYTYDAVGHLLTAIDPDSKYTYTYDAIDRVKSIDNTGTAGSPAVQLAYNYDAVGNLVSVTDAINGVTAATNAYTYDVLNRVTRVTQSGTGVQSKRVDMSYDAVNRLTGLSRYGDLTGTLGVADSSWGYDAAGRLTSLAHQRGATTIASYGFAYDAANRITQQSGTDGTQDYSYDDTNQLTAVDHSAIPDEAYSYDANGNRTNSGYGTGTNNRLLTDGVYNYQYDNEGNRTLRTEIATGKVTEYAWDYRNRLSSVVFKDAAGNVVKSIEYSYDSSDRRISKKVDGTVAERYAYDGANIALVFDGAGTQAHRYLYGAGVDQILADERGGSVVWALADNLGTVRDVVDGGGVVLNHVVYDSYGRVISQTNPAVEFRYGYTGREQDNETGLDYYRARYYDSAVGRFISEDPIGFTAGDANLYRYVGNSPVNLVDSSGLQSHPYSCTSEPILLASDLRKPTNTAIKNKSKQKIYVLIGNEKESHIEVLQAGAATPDRWGKSKDVDGIWIWRGKKEGWKFYTTEYPVTKGSLKPIVVDNKGVYYETILGDKVYINPWDGKSEKNSPDSRGRVSDIIPNARPNPRLNYPDASKWKPIAPEDISWKNGFGIIEGISDVVLDPSKWYVSPSWTIPPGL